MVRGMTFPVEVADKLLQAAADRGVPADELFGAAGVIQGSALSYAQLCALYEAAARLTGDSDFGLHVGERTKAEMYGLLGYAVTHSISLGEALERMRSLQAVWTRAVAFELRHGRDKSALRYGGRDGIPAHERRQECEQMMAAVLAFARGGADEDLRPLEVRFEHQAPEYTNEHKRIFACRLVFGAAATEIILSRKDLVRQLWRADPKLGALLQQQAQSLLAARELQEPLMDAVCFRVRQAIVNGAMPSLKQVADLLGLGPRTLQRRLRERSATWRSICEEARIGLAKELLADPRLALAQVAFRVGYSQTSAFHRAFRRVESVTPRNYRSRVLASVERR